MTLPSHLYLCRSQLCHVHCWVSNKSILPWQPKWSFWNTNLTVSHRGWNSSMDSQGLEDKVKIHSMAHTSLLAPASDLICSLASLSPRQPPRSTSAPLDKFQVTLFPCLFNEPTHIYLFSSQVNATSSKEFSLSTSSPSHTHIQAKCIYPLMCSCARLLSTVFAIIKSFSYLLTDCLTLSVDFKVPEGRICILLVYYDISGANAEPGHTEWCSVNSRRIDKIPKAFSHTGRSWKQPWHSWWFPCWHRSPLCRTYTSAHFPLQSQALKATRCLLVTYVCPVATRAKTPSVPETLLGRTAQAHPSRKNLTQKETNKEKPEREGCLYYS